MPHFMVDTKLYGWDMPEQALRREKNVFLVLSLLNAAISIACGVSPSQLMDLNGLKAGDGIKPGQVLKLPAHATKPQGDK